MKGPRKKKIFTAGLGHTANQLAVTEGARQGDQSGNHPGGHDEKRRVQISHGKTGGCKHSRTNHVGNDQECQCPEPKLFSCSDHSIRFGSLVVSASHGDNCFRDGQTAARMDSSIKKNCQKRLTGISFLPAHSGYERPAPSPPAIGSILIGFILPRKPGHPRQMSSGPGSREFPPVQCS